MYSRRILMSINVLSRASVVLGVIDYLPCALDASSIRDYSEAGKARAPRDVIRAVLPLRRKGCD